MNSRTIILFTSDFSDRAAARELVESASHEIEELDSAEAALASLLDDPCAVALVDLDASGACEILAALRAGEGRPRMPVLGASRRSSPEGAAHCDHIETGSRPFVALALELALALEEVEAVRPGQSVRPARDAEPIGVVRAVGEESVVVHLFGAGRRTLPLAAVDHVEADAILVDATALRGELGEALFRDDAEDAPHGLHRRMLDAPERAAMRKRRTSDKARHASHRQHPRFRPRALQLFATRLAQRWAASSTTRIAASAA